LLQPDAAAKGASIVGEQIEAEHDAVQLALPVNTSQDSLLTSFMERTARTGC
jgi:hypothetical protein